MTFDPDHNLDADVVIVGAGISGMTAAKRLEEAGLRVIAFDYEQPPYHPGCDAWRTLMTTEGLQMFSIPQSEEMLTVPDGEVARDPRLPCEGWKCDLE